MDIDEPSETPLAGPSGATAGHPSAAARRPPWIPADQREFIPPAESFLSGSSAFDSRFDEREPEDIEIDRSTSPIPYPEHPNLSEFHFSRILGQGSFGTVYLSRTKYNQHAFAMKVMAKPDCAVSSREAPRKNEVEILASLHHPFIIMIECAFQNDTHLFIGLQIATNGTFTNYLEAYAPMNTTQVQFYLCQIILALDYIHKSDVVHGDLKPDNILIADSGYIKISDFGLARTISNQQAPNVCFGTTYYMAPEMVRGTSFGPSVDWWALGVIMYQSLFACYPFDVEKYPPRDARFHRDDDKKVMLLINAGQYEIPREIEPPALAFLKRLLAPSASRRSLDWPTIRREYEYFREVDWYALHDREFIPPFRPPRRPLDPHHHQYEIDYAFQYDTRDQVAPRRDPYGGFFKDFYYLRTPFAVITPSQNTFCIPPACAPEPGA